MNWKSSQWSMVNSQWSIVISQWFTKIKLSTIDYRLSTKLIMILFLPSCFVPSRNKLFNYFIISIITLFASSCKIYRFTDASIDPNLKTFNVAPTINVATLQNPNAAPNFTDKLKDKFLSNTRMVLIQDNGDLQFAATIIEYNIEPVSITNTETTAQNRLNVSVKFECINTKEATKSFTQTFRDGENFDANAQFTSVESGLNITIFDRLTQQIFNKIFGNW